MTRGLTRAQRSAWVAYVRGSQLLDRAVDAQLRRDADLTHAEYELLARLSESPGRRLRMGALARRIVAPRSRLTYQVDRLVGRGLVVREDSPGDRRGTDAVLTAAGMALLERAAPGHVTAVRTHLVEVLSADELETLGALMARLGDALDD